MLFDLLVWRDARLERAEVAYWRTVSDAEVDFVIEAGGRLLPIEIKSAARPRLTHATHLRAFCEEYAERPVPARDREYLYEGYIRLLDRF